MPLTMRLTGLGSGIDKDRPDYGVYSGEWEIGRIYQTRGGPGSLRWFWSTNAHVRSRALLAAPLLLRSDCGALGRSSAVPLLARPRMQDGTRSLIRPKLGPHRQRRPLLCNCF